MFKAVLRNKMKFWTLPTRFSITFKGANIIGACRISVRGGEHFKGVGLVVGPGAELPDAGELSKICKKKVFRKLQKIIILAYFQNSLKKHALNFRAFGRKTQRVGKL